MAGIADSHDLKEVLADALPKDVQCRFYHYSTPPTKSPALFSAPPHRKPERTYCESHFLAVSITPKNTETTGAADEILVLAIEVLVYSTKQLTTIFVSKADSTGYLSLLSLPRSQAGSPLKTICGTFVSWLARERHREGKKLVVSLFARAQDQYLFPASIDNPGKHVLDDRGLVKWWCRVLDPLVREYAPEEDKKAFAERLAQGQDGAERSNTASSIPQTTVKGYLVVPGFDPYDTLRYTPAPPQNTPRRWTSAHPLLQIAPHPGAPPRCLVPHFPDDPKARFLDELDEELPDARTDDMVQQGGTPSRSSGQWKSIKTLDQFWETMTFRQECSSGRIVGFIWVVITPPSPSIPEEDEETEPSQSQATQNESQNSVLPPMTPPKSKRSSPKKPRRRKVNTEHGPIPLLLPRIKSSTSNLSTMSMGSNTSSVKLPPESTPYYTWPATSRGSILLSSSTYARAQEILLQQNFATRSSAVKSTKKWKDEIAVLGGVEQWGWTVKGRKEAPVADLASATINSSMPVTVMGVRKKRKPESESESAPQDTSAEQSGVQVLSAGLVRKKPKIEDAAPESSASAANGVNTLGAGLVRKKPKK